MLLLGVTISPGFARQSPIHGKERRVPEQKSVSPLYAAVMARCPRCGEGKLFKNVLETRASCGRCGLDYRFIDTGDGPAVFAIFILGFLILGGALYVEFTFEPPVWVHVVLWGRSPRSSPSSSCAS